MKTGTERLQLEMQRTEPNRLNCRLVYTSPNGKKYKKLREYKPHELIGKRKEEVIGELAACIKEQIKAERVENDKEYKFVWKGDTYRVAADSDMYISSESFKPGGAIYGRAVSSILINGDVGSS